MIMLLRGKHKESGVASLVVVIFMAIILTIVTIGFLRIALNEQRDATDDDLTARAFYAAESGLEDARRAIQDDLAGEPITLNENTCDAPTGYTSVLSTDAAFDIGYSCMLIDYTPATIEANLASANQTRQYKIKPLNLGAGSNNIGRITLQWHIDADVANGGDGLIPGSVALRGSGDTSLPPLSGAGGWNYPSLMKVMFISYPNNNIDRGNIQSATTYLNPTTAVAATTSSVFSNANSPHPTVNGQIINSHCETGLDGDMACTQTFSFQNWPQSNNLEIRLTNQYVPTTFALTMETQAGQPLVFDEAQAVVDVTGYAGEVFRRVEAVLDLSRPDLLPEYALQSAEDLCKDFSFTDVPAGFGGTAPTSCN